MAKEPELKARDKVVVRMTREGAVEENLTTGTEQRVSKRLEDAELVKPVETAEPSEALSAEEQKKVQMRRQQRQFQAEHAEDNDTQPSSETSVTEEKKPENPPQNAPEPLPLSETPFKPPVLEQHGVSPHTGTVIAETVVTHSSRHLHSWIIIIHYKEHPVQKSGLIPPAALSDTFWACTSCSFPLQSNRLW